MGAFFRQSLPGGVRGGVGETGQRGSRSAPLREQEGEARRLRWRQPRRAGRGRGARRAESARGPRRRGGRGRAGSCKERGQRSGSPPPGTWPRRAVQVRAGAWRAGLVAGGGTRASPGGAAGSGEPFAQVGGGSATTGGSVARPDPSAWRGVSSAPRPSCAPSQLVGHRALLAIAPLERARFGRPCPVQLSGAISPLRRPWADPGMGTERDVPRLQIHPIPRNANQDAPPCPATLALQDATTPAPSSVRRPRFLLPQEGCPWRAGWGAALPPPSLGGRASGFETSWGPVGSVLP